MKKKLRKIKTKLVKCIICDGTGMVNNAERCKFCNESGKMEVADITGLSFD
jgi:RecJ-like exonuclease